MTERLFWLALAALAAVVLVESLFPGWPAIVTAIVAAAIACAAIAVDRPARDRRPW